MLPLKDWATGPSPGSWSGPPQVSCLPEQHLAHVASDHRAPTRVNTAAQISSKPKLCCVVSELCLVEDPFPKAPFTHGDFEKGWTPQEGYCVEEFKFPSRPLSSTTAYLIRRGSEEF